MKSLFLIGVLLVSLAHAGERGNGGVSVVCRDDQGKILSAELLDIYEGEVLYQHKFVRNMDVDGYLKLVKERLSSFTKMVTTDTPTLPFLFDRAFDKMNQSMYFIEKGNTLQPTFDAFPLSLKDNCSFEQVANYSYTGDLFISKEIFEAFDDLNKAALYAHEVLYQVSGQSLSVHVRKLNALLFTTIPNYLMIEDVTAHLFNAYRKKPKCGLEGSIEERMADCSVPYSTRRKFILVSRNDDQKEVYMDAKNRKLWSYRAYRQNVPYNDGDYKNHTDAAKACESGLDGTLPPARWRLVSKATDLDTTSAEELLLSYMNNSSLWTSDLKAKATPQDVAASQNVCKKDASLCDKWFVFSLNTKAGAAVVMAYPEYQYRANSFICVADI